MKTINISFEDDDFKQLDKAKETFKKFNGREMGWRDLFVHLCKAYNGNLKEVKWKK